MHLPWLSSSQNPRTRIFIALKVDVVEVAVPFLLGPNTLDRFGMYYNNFYDTLCCPHFSWNVPAARKLGHTYLEWNLESPPVGLVKGRWYEGCDDPVKSRSKWSHVAQSYGW